MKKSFLVAVVLLASAAVQASYLYWTVDSSISTDNTGASYTMGQPTGSTFYEGAVMHAVNGSSDTALQYHSVGTDGRVSGDLGTQAGAGTWVVDVSTLKEKDGYSFYIEYIGYNAATGGSGQIAVGETKTYAELASSMAEYDGISLKPVSAANIWHGGTVNAPEPTSAMLMLLGVAGLALRRKQRKLA